SPQPEDKQGVGPSLAKKGASFLQRLAPTIIAVFGSRRRCRRGPVDGTMSAGLVMPDKLTPEYWRNRAEEVRTLAADMMDRQARAALLNIAEQYEDLAKRAEERQRSQ